MELNLKIFLFYFLTLAISKLAYIESCDLKTTVLAEMRRQNCLQGGNGGCEDRRAQCPSLGVTPRLIILPLLSRSSVWQ